MKIKKLFAGIVAVCLFLTGCSSSFNWDKSVTKLQDAGYTITKNYTEQVDLDRITHEINAEFKMHKKNHTAEVLGYMTLDKDALTCVYLQFKEDEQAKNYYDLRLSYRLDVDKLQLYLNEDILLITNTTEVADLLNINFN